MEAQRTCRLIKERFAGREETIERLFRRSETFRCLCRDYLACAAVLNWWERSDLERARRRAAEFTEMLAELRKDILRWLQTEEAEGGLPSPNHGPNGPDDPARGD